ncbi:hypothetical protein FRB96_003328 [Tulasnella sp. 330]|nr:hypothetical protein FRB96_003328 [Tulasnella sp. 330]
MAPIFCGGEDEPLSIYIQADASFDQVARLNTLIATHGGQTIDSSESSHIIVIVDRTTKVGNRLVIKHAVRPNEQMVHAIVDDAWIGACIEAGEILIDDENDWHGHLIRAPRMSSIQDMLRRRRSIADSASRPPAPRLDARATSRDGPSQPRADGQQPPLSPTSHHQQNMSPATPQQPPAPGLALPPESDEPGLGLATPPSERRPISPNDGSSPQGGPSRLGNKSERTKGKERVVIPSRDDRPEGGGPPVPPSANQKVSYAIGRHLFTDLERNWIKGYLGWAAGQGMSWSEIYHAIQKGIHWHSVKSVESHLIKYAAREYESEMSRVKAARTRQGGSTTVPHRIYDKATLLAKKQKDQSPESSDEEDPAPAPPRHIEMISNQGYRFTGAEQKWVIEYADWLFDRKPKTTLVELINCLYDEAHHHSTASWRWHLRDKINYYCAKSPKLKALLKPLDRRGTAAHDTYEENVADDNSEGESENGSESGGDAVDNVDTDRRSSTSGVRSLRGRNAPLPTSSVEGEPYTNEDLQVLSKFMAQHWDGDSEEVKIADAEWHHFAKKNPRLRKAQWRMLFKEQRLKIARLARKLLRSSGSHVAGPSSTRHQHSTIRSPSTDSDDRNKAGPSATPNRVSHSPNDIPKDRQTGVLYYTQEDDAAIVRFLADNPQAYFPRTFIHGEKQTPVTTLWKIFRDSYPNGQSHSSSAWSQYHRSKHLALQAEANKIRAARRGEVVQAPKATGTSANTSIYISDEEEEEEVLQAVAIPAREIKIEEEQTRDPDTCSVNPALSGDQHGAMSPSPAGPPALKRIRTHSTPVRPLTRLDPLPDNYLFASQTTINASAGPSKKRKSSVMESEGNWSPSEDAAADRVFVKKIRDDGETLGSMVGKTLSGTRAIKSEIHEKD